MRWDITCAWFFVGIVEIPSVHCGNLWIRSSAVTMDIWISAQEAEPISAWFILIFGVQHTYITDAVQGCFEPISMVDDRLQVSSPSRIILIMINSHVTWRSHKLRCRKHKLDHDTYQIWCEHRFLFWLNVDGIAQIAALRCVKWSTGNIDMSH